MLLTLIKLGFSLLLQIALAWWNRRANASAIKRQAQDVANAPETKQEQIDYYKNK